MSPRPFVFLGYGPGYAPSPTLVHYSDWALVGLVAEATS